MRSSGSAERTVLLGYLLSICGILALAYACYAVPWNLVKSTRLIAEAERVIATIGDIETSALDAESTARAYLITGSPDMRQHYDALVPTIFNALEAYEQMTVNDTDQQARAAKLREQIKNRFAFLTSTVQEREKNGFVKAHVISAQGIGRESMNRIRATIESMNVHEHRKIATYRGEEERKATQLTIVIVAVVSIGLAILSWITWQTWVALTIRRKAEAQAEHGARHDVLTGLPNRRLLMERLAQLLARGQRHGTFFAVLSLDLDGFKQVNDTHGHGVGDDFLSVVGKHLRAAVRTEDTVARVGGDEFVVALDTLGSPDDALVAGNKLVQTVSLCADTRAYHASVSASVGVAVYPEDAGDETGLLMLADRALYSAKKTGKGRVVRYAR